MSAKSVLLVLAAAPEGWLCASRLLGVLLHRSIPTPREGYTLERLS